VNVYYVLETIFVVAVIDELGQKRHEEKSPSDSENKRLALAIRK
jgi:hypothetical protein